MFPSLNGQMPQIEADPDDVTPENLARILHSDNMRMWRVDIETDSTVQADVSEAQRNMSGFVQGLASYLQAIGPAVQAGVVKVETAADLLKAFARAYKLGRSAETAIEDIGKKEEPEPGEAPPVPQGPSPEEVAAKQKADAEAAKTQAEMAGLQRDEQLSQAQFAAEMKKMQNEMVVAQQQMQLDMAKMQLEMQKLSAQAAVLAMKQTGVNENGNPGGA